MELLMYIITNRQLTKKDGLKSFGKDPNPKGPNELRMTKVLKSGNKWKVSQITDTLSLASKKSLKKKYQLDIDVNETWHASLKIACELFEKARKQKKSILFFVHGFNNDVGDVIKAAQDIEAIHDVIVVPFTWPANGGGALTGTASYKSDKSDARASTGALNRFIAKIQQFHQLLTAAQLKRIRRAADKKHPNNHDAAHSMYTNMVEKECSTRISLLCHSMGNYLLKHTLSTSENSTSELVFDNVCLVAADTNNKNHALWVGKLDVRNRVYVVINEKDSALKASRIKPGKEQKARLGHYINKLDSLNAHYIDVTGAKGVGSEHTYFKGPAVKANKPLRDMFGDMFKGLAVEQDLEFQSDSKSYKFK